MAAVVPSAILHVPHSSTFIPDDIRPSLRLGDEALRLELLAMTDLYTDELFAVPASVATTVRYAFSRLVVDPERFPDDGDEPMARVGMGAIYERTSDGAVLRTPLSESDRSAVLARFYRPHHDALDSAASAALSAHDRCLVVDCHSFPATPRPYELDQRPDRPDICIGTDPVHTPDALREMAVALFSAHGMSVEVDRPYAGTIVPAAHYGREPRVRAVMVEINRRLYVDESTGVRTADFGGVCAIVQEAIFALIDAHE